MARDDRRRTCWIVAGNRQSETMIDGAAASSSAEKEDSVALGVGRPVSFIGDDHDQATEKNMRLDLNSTRKMYLGLNGDGRCCWPGHFAEGERRLRSKRSSFASFLVSESSL